MSNNSIIIMKKGVNLNFRNGVFPFQCITFYFSVFMTFFEGNNFDEKYYNEVYLNYIFQMITIYEIK